MQSPSILLVEDELIAAEVVCLTLEEIGFRVTGSARTRAEALASAGEEKPALALVDIRLARGDDGVDLARELRQDFGIPVIIMSASSDPATQARAAEAGVLGFISKPYRAAALLAEIRRVLGPAQP